MTLWQRITREPAALLGVATAVVALLVGLGVISPELGGSVGAVLGALVVLLRQVVTPSAEVLAQAKPDGTVIAGRASDIVTGTVVEPVNVMPAGQPPAVREAIARTRAERRGKP